ncbi:TPA: plasmid SOS inhibition protein A [Klebsiella aerogenes]|nr:plasmid SOS inhibition protein A [Klebsiella aerogenes]
MEEALDTLIAMHEISFIVRESGDSILERERWLVPNKLTDGR